MYRTAQHAGKIARGALDAHVPPANFFPITVTNSGARKQPREENSPLRVKER
jgi:hypothetical protein